MLKTLALATLLCAAPLLATAQQSQPPHDAKGHAETKRIDGRQEPDKSFWQRTTTDPVAAFTGVLALFTAILTGVSIIQIRFLTLSDKTARDAAVAAKLAANAANRQASSVVAMELPILVIERVDAGDNLWVRVIVANYGRTPAIVVADCMDFSLDQTLPDEPTYANRWPITRDELVERDRPYGTFGRKFPLPDTDWCEVMAGKKNMWIYGYIDYLDFRKRRHREGFCVVYYKSMDVDGYEGMSWGRTGPSAYTYNKSQDD